MLCFLRSSQHILVFFGRCLQENAPVFYVRSTVDTRANVGLQSLPNFTHFLHDGGLAVFWIASYSSAMLGSTVETNFASVYGALRLTHFSREGGPRSLRSILTLGIILRALVSSSHLLVSAAPEECKKVASSGR